MIGKIDTRLKIVKQVKVLLLPDRSTAESGRLEPAEADDFIKPHGK